MIDPGRQAARELLEQIIGQIKFSPGDTDMQARVSEVAKYAYEGAEPHEWEEVAERVRQAFDLDLNGRARVGKGSNGHSTHPVDPNVVVHQGQVDEAVDDIGRAALLSSEFDALVVDGFFRDYLDWTRDQESPAQFHFGAATTTIAASLGRQPLIEWGARPLYPNIYSLLVGPTGARKGAAIDRAVRLVEGAMGTYVLPTEGTHQGFASALRARGEATFGASSDGLIIAPEFSVLMSKDQNKADLVKWLTDWYDCPDSWERALRGEPDYKLFNLCVSVLGGSNIEWLRTMPAHAITGGFFPRILLFYTPDRRHSNYDPKFNADLELKMRRDLAAVKSRVPETIGFSAEAAAYMKHWYEGELDAAYRATTDEQARAWLARKQAAVMKLAVVWQLADGGPTKVIEERWLAQARGVVDWTDQAVWAVYGALGVSPEGMIVEEVRTFIRRAGGKASKRALLRELSRRYTEGRVEIALRTLRASGEIKHNVSPLEGSTWELKA